MAKSLKKKQPKPSRKPPAKAAAKKQSPPKAAAKKPLKSKPPKPQTRAPRAKAKQPPAPLRGAPKPQSSSPSAIPASRPASSEPSRSIQTLFGASPTNQAQTRYLTSQDLIDLHRAVSVEFGGRDAAPGVVESQFGLMNSVQRPQATVFGRDAYPTFPEKAAAFVFAFLQNAPFQGGNRRVALAALVAFCELNGRAIDGRVLDEKTLETLIKRSAGHRDLGIAPEEVFREVRELFGRGIVQQATT